MAQKRDDETQTQFTYRCMRNEIIDECVKVAMDAFGKIDRNTFVLEGPGGIARRMVNSIRAMKDER